MPKLQASKFRLSRLYILPHSVSWLSVVGDLCLFVLWLDNKWLKLKKLFAARALFMVERWLLIWMASSLHY